MVNAQKWLEEHYSDKKTKSIYINQQLEGVLDCSEYKNLWKIFISTSVDSNIEIKNASYKEYGEVKETNVIPCVSTQTYLDKEYPTQEKREGLKNLRISEKALEGNLDLSDFKNLEELSCSDNYLTNLNLNDCKELKTIRCQNNQLTTLDLGNLAELEQLNCSNNYLTQIIYSTNPKKITSLDISNNNFLISDLSIFSKFKNLKTLQIGNEGKNKINQGIYNRFSRSLEPLKDLTKLADLEINNTDLNSEWECLPTSLKSIRCSTEERPESKVKKIAEQLDCFPQWTNQGFNGHQFKEWIDFGLKLSEYVFAKYLTGNGCNPQQKNLDLNEWKTKWGESSKKSQEWLDQNYPKEERNEVKEIHITEQLEGELDLKEFTYHITSSSYNISVGVMIYVSPQVDITKLFFKNLPEDAEVFLTIAQKYLDYNYPKNGTCLRNDEAPYINNFGKTREKITALHINGKGLEGSLNLENFPNLKKFYCSGNKLTSLDLSSCEQLEELYLSGVIEQEFKYFKEDLKKFKEFNGSARMWLDQNYPENGKCQRRDSNGEKHEDYGKKRTDITQLDISKQNLEKGLWLKGFTNLKNLNCSDNQLTDLELSDCKYLVELKCNNNLKFAFKNLNFLSHLNNLKELNLSDCHEVKVSLKPSKNLTKLEKLDISNTDIKEGLEYLPESIKKFCCELDYKYDSVEIAKELSKFSEGVDEESGHTKYNLDKWRTDQANKVTASVIPLERLYVIRGNLSQFLKKWNLNELIKLQSPEQYNKFGYLSGAQTFFNSLATAGGALTLANYTVQGGIISLVSPVLGTVVGQMKTNLYDAKQGKWKDFLVDVSTLLDNYNELLGLLKGITDENLVGEVNEEVKNLNEKVHAFLTAYDKNTDGEISVDELTNERENFANELGKLQDIVDTIKDLENQVIAFKKGEEIEERDASSDPKEQVDDSKIKIINFLESPKIKEKIEELRRRKKQLERNKSKLEVKLKEAKTNNSSIENQINLDLIKILEIKDELSNIKKQLVRNQFVHLNNQVKSWIVYIENLTNINWSSEISQGWENTKNRTAHAIDYLKEILNVPHWYWEQWKDRGSAVIDDSPRKEEVTETTKPTSPPTENSEVKEIVKEGATIELKETENPTFLNWWGKINKLFWKDKESTTTQTQLKMELQNLEKPSTEWKAKGFTKEETQAWISIGVDDIKFATWLRDEKSKELENFNDPQWVSENADLSELRKEYLEIQNDNKSTNALTVEEIDNEQHAVIEVVPTPSNSSK